MESDGRNARQLTFNTEGIPYALRVSPDGHYVVFASAGGYQIWRIDIDGNNAKQLTNSVLNNVDSLDFSPDGKSVVYNKWGAEKGIWKVSVEGGDPVRLSDAEAFTSAISPDGRWIAFSYRDEKATPSRGVAIMALAGGSPTRRVDVVTRLFRWDASGRSLVYTKNEGGVENIWSQPIAGGPPKQITHFSSLVIWSFDLSRDGKRLVMDRGIDNRDVVLIRDLR
jgi:Tol biopolymer transport system component